MLDAALGFLESVLKLLPWLCVAPVVVLFLIAMVFLAWDTYRRTTNGHFRHWLRTRRGRGFDVTELARRLDLTVDELRNVDICYRTQWIRKRSGGQRRLEIPGPELKSIQKRILKRLLAKLRTHAAVTGFETGCSIVDNAAPHVAQAVVINIDVRDFFTATKAGRVEKYFQRVGWNREAATLLTQLVTYEDGLPQGAPTSPRLSNLLNMRLDSRIDRSVKRRKGTYTRYADDITISFPKDYPRKVRGIVQAVRRQLKSHGYQMHADKLRIQRPHQQQKVTGLVVNKKVNLPRSVRRKLRAIEHRLRTGQEATLTPQQLAGWHALQEMIDRQSQQITTSDRN